MKHLSITAIIIAAAWLLTVMDSACAQSAEAPIATEIPQVIRWQAAGAPPGIPGGPSLFIADASAPYWPDTLVLAISAHDLANVKSVSGIIRYQPDVIRYLGTWSHGKWFMSGTGTTTWTVRAEPGEIRFRLNRYEAISGDGEILLLHFVPANGDLKHRSTTVGWDGPQVNGIAVAALGGAVFIN